MFGKMIGAFAGAQASKYTTAVGGTGGAVLGALAAPMVRRMSIPAMVVIGAGGYLAKRWYARREAERAATPTANGQPARAAATRKRATPASRRAAAA